MPCIAKPSGPLAHAWFRFLRLFLLLGCVAGAAACVANSPAGRGPFPAFAEYEAWEVREVRFVGDLQLPVDSLQGVIVTRATRCRLLFLPFCLPFTGVGRDEYHLDLQELGRDVARLQLYYRDHGYFGTRVVPSVDPLEDEEVAVRFAIAPGDQVLLQELTIEGVEDILPPEELRRSMPLTEGEPFRRIGFLSAADTIRAALLRRGYAYADVLRNYSLDTIADIAEAQFIALPGPPVYVDTVLFIGANRFSERTLRRQLTFREGDLLKVPELGRSQRNLYDLQMVSFASLGVAPDSLQQNPDSTRATVLARVVEAPQYLVDAAVGLGTIECFRTEGRYLDRNFLGGGRSLEVNGLISRIGAAPPLDAGLENSICGGADEVGLLDRPEFNAYLDYRLAGTFQQPRLLNTRNELTVNVHWERLTELNAYLRESVGGQIALGRELGANSLLSTNLLIQRGRTLANPVVFCVGFELCEPESFGPLERFRWSNALSATLLQDRTQTDRAVARGYRARTSVDWASPLLLSDNEFLRVQAEGSIFEPLRPGWLLAGHLRAGSFLLGALGGEAGFIPPEYRFYAGGPNSVRGYSRNALGPTAYVIQPELNEDGVPTGPADTIASATGGTQMVVATAELRTPSPIFSEFFRFATFVDAGQVWARGTPLKGRSLVFTPGIGLRVMTPVGPIRLDVAYNGYPSEAGPLYRLDPENNALVRVKANHRPPDPTFWRRLEFSFAVGQAF